jgi:hypothetical protein
MKGLTKSLIAPVMAAGLIVAGGNTLHAELPFQATPGNADGSAPLAVAPSDPKPNWGNPNGTWILWWGFGQRDNWKEFKSYNNRERADYVARALRDQGFVTTVSAR